MPSPISKHDSRERIERNLGLRDVKIGGVGAELLAEPQMMEDESPPCKEMSVLGVNPLNTIIPCHSQSFFGCFESKVNLDCTLSCHFIRNLQLR